MLCDCYCYDKECVFSELPVCTPLMIVTPLLRFVGMLKVLLLLFIGKKHSRGVVISPSVPSSKGGLYWGYEVRHAHSFGAVFTEAPYEVSSFGEEGIDCLLK